MNPQVMPVEPANPDRGDQVRVATRRRRILAGGLVAGLVVALGFAGVVIWQRGVAVEERALAEKNEAQAQDNPARTTDNFRRSQRAAESSVSDIVQVLRNVQVMPKEAAREVLETLRATFDQLAPSTPDDP